MISKDLVLDSNDDLTIVDGDWFIGQSDDQNIEAILKASKGHFYQFPLLGYGILGRLNSPINKATEKRDIREELKRDDYNVIQLIIENDFTIYVDADKVK